MPHKTVAFLPSHPAQLWLMRPVVVQVSHFANTLWVLRDKDCELELARLFNLDHILLSKAPAGLLDSGAMLLLDIARVRRLTRKHDIDLWVTKYGAGNIGARLAGRRSLSFNDDDADVVPLIAWTSYPFADCIVAPTLTRMGRFHRKTIRFPGNFELFYLHPNRFTPDRAVLEELGVAAGEPYAIIRLSALQAHHDVGVRGVGEALLRRVLALLDGRIRVFISSEQPLADEFEPYRLPIRPDRIHHALAFADFFLGDSQTMTSEAAVLGIPALRINDFVGRLSYLDELERYGLSFGFRPGEEDRLVAKLSELLAIPDRSGLFRAQREAFLREKVDPVPWMTNIIRLFCQESSLSAVRRAVR